MTSFRAIVTVAVISGAFVLGAMSTAWAQPGSQKFSRCPQSPTQYAVVMKQLVADASRARALADENPLLEPDAFFYEAELAATRSCAPAVASLEQHPAR
jgi:hypothetical protein